MASIILELQCSYLPNKNFDILHEMVENLCYIWPMRKEEDSLNVLITKRKMKLLHANVTHNRDHLSATTFFVSYTENFFKIYPQKVSETRHNRWFKKKGDTQKTFL